MTDADFAWPWRWQLDVLEPHDIGTAIDVDSDGFGHCGPISCSRRG
jgi:hypothetical protein